MSVYVWGSNKHHQLIGQDGLHSYAPSLVTDEFDGQIPVQVASGDGHAMVLFESGDIYSFGRNVDGQLGHEVDESCTKGQKSIANKIVTGLEQETIVGIAAGSMTSYAITAAGEVYQWGLIFRPANYSATQDTDVLSAARAGELNGMGQDQQIMVEVDMEARETQATAKGRHRSPPQQSRQLREIVRDSTERWMMPTDESEREYFEELSAMGYAHQDVEVRKQSRGREYESMLDMGCIRYPQLTPSLIRHMTGIRIVSVSSGYSHVMLLSDRGQLYGAGYNDRGQLGLGHRINTSEFKHVDFLENKFVGQVVCGQQHTMCRAVDATVDSNGIVHSSTVFPETVFVGSDVGADVFVWGNGVLGQLGIGRIGTSKGRLLPSLLTSMCELYPLGVVDIGAGENFSAVVTVDGSVYSFGHAEYNQHGTGSQAPRDYTDPYHYFVPRPIEAFNQRAGKKAPNNAMETMLRGMRNATSTGPEHKAKMKRMSCGANFTVGIDEVGNLYSWGWNESGVLGHGFNHFSSSPSALSAIGTGFDGCKVVNVMAGSKHVIALTQAQGNTWALTFRSFLDTAPHSDCVITVNGAGSSTVSFPCHRAILACRSKYFRGYIHAAERQALEDKLYKQRVEGTVEGSDSETPLTLYLLSAHANASTTRSLLEYLYLDRVHIPYHKRRELLHLAKEMHISLLIDALEADNTSIASATRGVPGATEKKSSAASDTAVMSTSHFVRDLSSLFDSQAFCDIIFVDGPLLPSVSGCDCGEEDTQHALFQPSDFNFVLYAHQIIVSRIAYFEAIVRGQYSESSNFVTLLDPLNGTPRSVLCVDISGLQVDGVDLQTFLGVMRYAYTGRLAEIDQSAGELSDEVVDTQLVMSALVAANLLGFPLLVQHCERVLSLHIGEFYPKNAENCLSFAVAYNMTRLERQCLKVLKRGGDKGSDKGGVFVGGSHEKA